MNTTSATIAKNMPASTAASVPAGGHSSVARPVGNDGPWRPAGWNTVGLFMVLPFAVIFSVFVVYPVVYGFWLARDPGNYVALVNDPVFVRTLLNTIVFLVVAINVKMLIALGLASFFLQTRWWIKVLAVLFILPWAVPSIPTILSIRFLFNSEWGLINTLIFQYTGLDGPNWLNDPSIGFAMAIVTHIWKSLPFWTLVLLSGRMAISKDMYEAAAVDGATRFQQFRYITWPAMRQLFLTCTLLSTIWTLGDFNSVYLLTGGGPADLTHVLATLGIRYLRLDQIELSMATVVIAMPLVLPLVYFMVRRLSGNQEEAR